MGILIPSVLLSLNIERAPAWVLLQEARFILEGSQRSYKNQDFSRAIFLLNEALAKRGIYPEADLFLARIYAYTGDRDLQMRSLDRAIAYKDYLDNSQGTYVELYYEQAKLALLDGDFQGSVDLLRSILDEDIEYRMSRELAPPESILRAFLEKVRGLEGIERAFQLYRDSNSRNLAVHSLLGSIYFQARAFELAVYHHLYVVLGVLSRVMDGVILYEPHYSFVDLRGLFEKVENYPELKKIFLKVSFWDTYSKLAEATLSYRQGDYAYRSFELWRQIIEFSDNESFRVKAVDHMRRFESNPAPLALE